MSHRILSLTGYLLYLLSTSWTGVAYVAISIAFYLFAFRTRTPEADYFILVLGGFGAFLAFLLTLSFAARANEAASYPILVRLQSRVEYITAVMLAAVLTSLLFVVVLAAVALLRNSPELSLGRALQIPPIWLSLIIVFSVLALHASDFVAAGWSRVTIFGLLAIFLVVGENSTSLTGWLADQFNQLSAWSYQQGSVNNGQTFQQVADWFNGGGSSIVQELFGLVFWPFHAIFAGTIGGSFTEVEALAPGTLLIYATILFLLAADFFANKDLLFTEE